MTKLGFYFIYGNKYDLVKIIDVPWDFKINAPDGVLPQYEKPEIGSWDNEEIKYYGFSSQNIADSAEYGIITVGDLAEITPPISEDTPIYTVYRLIDKTTSEDIFQVLKRTIYPYDWEKLLAMTIMKDFIIRDMIFPGETVYISERGYQEFRVEILPLIHKFLNPSNITVQKEILVYMPINEPDTGIMPLVEEENPTEIPSTPIIKPSEVPSAPITPLPDTRNNFPKWITKYFYRKLIPQKGFLDIFHKDRTYVIIPVESPMDMGLMRITKGRTKVNFEEFDYRVLIHRLHPNLEKDIIKPDESFVGYDDDKDFNQNKRPEIPDTDFGGYDNDSNFLI